MNNCDCRHFCVKDEPPTEEDNIEDDERNAGTETDPLDIGFHYLMNSTENLVEDKVRKRRKKPDKKRDPVRYECKTCALIFTRKARYERHMNKHNRPKKPENASYKCEKCDENFTRKSAYIRHMYKHTSEKPHKCTICGKGFKRSYEVTAHMDIHGGPKYSCEICDFTTAYKVSLRTHTRRVHQKDYPHKCDQCEKGFMSKYELDDHKTSHSGTKSFVCEMCGNAYSQRTYLLYHKRVIHGVLNRAPKELKCEICDKTFATEYCLKNHVSLHSQKFLCSQCGKEFASNHSLKMHVRMHTGERPHKCNICSKGFSRSNALAVHKLTHTGERPYVCDLCDKSFTQRTTLMAHRKKHPGKHPPPPPTHLSKRESAGDSHS